MEVRSVPLLALMFAFAGCSSGPGGADAASEDSAAIVDDGVTPPDIPWLDEGVPPIALPMFTPCPDGWREVPPEEAGDPATCDPYPASGALDCPAGQAHFPGESGCTPVGAPCPSGEFAAGLPVDGTVIYVRPGAMGGDGTEARPYGSFSEIAFGGLPTSTIIALSVGMHDGPVSLSRGQILEGACAEATVVRTPMPHAASEGVITLLGTGGAVRNLTIADSPRRGVRLADATVEGRLEGVVVTRVQSVAVSMTRGARLSAQAVVLSDTAPRATDGALGRGLSAQRGATADVSRALVLRNREYGLFGNGMGAALTLSDVFVHATESRAEDGTGGRGLTVTFGATAQVSRALVSQSREIEVVAFDPGSALTLSDVVLRDTQSRPTVAGRSLSVDEGATAVVNRALLSRNRALGVYATGAGTSLVLSDAVVRDAVTGLDGIVGIGVQFGATVEVSRALMSRNREIGVYASDAGSLLLSDIVVRDTQSRASDGRFGRGLNVELGATAEVSRARLTRNREVAVYASGVDTALTLSDAIVHDTESEASDGSSGRGLALDRGALAEVSRALLSGNRDVGLLASAMGTTLTLSDAIIRDTEGRTSDETGGRGMVAQRGATVEVSRALVSGNRELGVAALGDADASLEDVVVSGTSFQICTEPSCAGYEGGHGVGSYLASAVRMTRFSVRGSALCGVHLVADASIDLRDGEVRGQPIGVCLQADGYDTTRFTSGVRYEGNDLNLQATTLPVPDPSTPIEP